MVKAALIVLFTLCSSAAVASNCNVEKKYTNSAFSMPMQFFNASSGGNASQAQWIVGVGVIEASTDILLKKYLKNNNSYRPRLILHSPGGSLIGGLRLGTAIREAGISTLVGQTKKYDVENDYPCRTLVDQVVNGECSSSCAYAFLGGVMREISTEWFPLERNKLGFHQFWFTESFSKSIAAKDAKVLQETTLSDAQIAMGLVAEYLSLMNIDARVISFAAKAGPDSMHYPSFQELSETQVITQSSFGAWFIEPYQSGLVAASRELNPLTPIQQITTYCRVRDASKVLMITSDFSKTRETGFAEPTSNVSNPKKSEYGASVTIDGFEFVFPSEMVKVATADKLHFYRVELPNALAEKLVLAKQLEVKLNSPSSFGFHYGKTSLGNTGRKSVALSFKNCV